MRTLAIVLGLVVIIILMFWYALGSDGITIAASVIGTLAIVGGVWVLSSMWTASLMDRGAEIALRSQESDDVRDRNQTASLTALVREVIKMKESHQARLTTNQQPVPPATWAANLQLPNATQSDQNQNGDVVEGSFTIGGLEEDD